MTTGNKPAVNTVTVKCVVCSHRETIPLTSEQPMCTRCLGPVVVEKVTRKL